MNKPIKVWTDGSCLGNPGPGGWAYKELNSKVVSGSCKDTTNNSMELYAIYQVLITVAFNKSVRIFSDSKYSINIITGRWRA